MYYHDTENTFLKISLNIQNAIKAYKIDPDIKQSEAIRFFNESGGGIIKGIITYLYCASVIVAPFCTIGALTILILKPANYIRGLLTKGYIFISYKSDNWKRVFLDKVFQLREQGVRVYSDKNFDDENRPWLTSMEKNMKFTTAVMLFISKEYVTSLPTLIELLTAIKFDKLNQLIKIQNPKYQEKIDTLRNNLETSISQNTLTYANIWESFQEILYSGRLQDNDFDKKLSSLLKTIHSAYLTAIETESSEKNRQMLNPFERPYQEIIQRLDSAPASGAPSAAETVAEPPKTMPEPPVTSTLPETKQPEPHTPSPVEPARKPHSSTGAITFTLYGKEYTTNQSDMMLLFFAQVLNRYPEVISEVGSYKGMNCVSDVDYTAKENQTPDMPPYFRICQYFTFPNGEKLCVGTAYAIGEKLKKMALLLSICGEASDIFQSEQVELPVVRSAAEKGDSSRGKSSGVDFRVFGESFSANQSDMLGIICNKLIEKHPEKLKEAADSLLCIDMADYTGVAKENKPVYFGSMNQYYLNGTPYCVGGSFGMKDKLKMIARLIALCEESSDCIEIEGYEIPAVGSSRSAGKKTSINYFG